MKFLIVLVLSLLGIAGSTKNGPTILTRAKFMVKLEIPNSSGCTVCSGSFIVKNWILTAGHCIDDANYLVVYPIFKEDNGYIVKNTDIIKHTYVQGSVSRHDIALIRFPYNESWGHIWPVRLPNALDSPSAYHGKKAIFIGFDTGCTGNFSGFFDIMYLTIVKEQSCTLGTRFFYLTVPLREEHLCARTRQSNLCEDDSSGHLFLKDSNELVAILSQPKDKSCSELIFSRISYYTKFIEIVTGIDLPGGGWNRRNGMEQNNSTLQEKLNFAKLQNT